MTLVEDAVVRPERPENEAGADRIAPVREQPGRAGQDGEPVAEDGRTRWQSRYRAAEAAGGVRDADFTTLSGLEVDPVYGPLETPSSPAEAPALRANRLAG